MRGDGAIEDVDEVWPPKDERVVGDDDDDDFPLPEGSSADGIDPPKGKSAPAQVLLETAALGPESPPLIFPRSK